MLLVIGLVVGGWGYYSGLQKDRVNISKSLVGVAQNAYNAGQLDISISQLKNIVEEYSGTDAGNQALVYLLKDAYQANNDEIVLSLGDEHGASISDGVLDARFHEMLGNASMNMNDIDAAINNFKKADKLSFIENIYSRYKIGLAVAFIIKKDFGKAASVLNEMLENENVNYSDKNKAEELLAFANFSKDN